jgi:aryl-alcohol dehydrogenase-like predicted oxidoreductase
MCLDEGMRLLPFGTLGNGRYQTEATYVEREKDNPGRKFPAGPAENVSKILETIEEKKDNAHLTGVAMAYIMQKAPYTFPLVGCRTLEHLKGNIAALGISLSEDKVAEIETAVDFDPGFPHPLLRAVCFQEGQRWE